MEAKAEMIGQFKKSKENKGEQERHGNWWIMVNMPGGKGGEE